MSDTMITQSKRLTQPADRIDEASETLAEEIAKLTRPEPKPEKPKASETHSPRVRFDMD